ncbi:hypothetical protein V1514DRAFT_283492 [Lipomyces japonicus]|uniref:uncharacterized protein n=1 Tax=Lipomyces japonicus TaxID=56871 RepID=UPI0034CE5EB7
MPPRTGVSPPASPNIEKASTKVLTPSNDQDIHQHVTNINPTSEVNELEKHFFPDHEVQESLQQNASRAQPSEWSYQQMASPTIKQEELAASNDTTFGTNLTHDNNETTKITATGIENKEVQVNADDEWQEMPVFATHDIYDDDGKIIAHEEIPSEDEQEEDERRGGATKGYTRVTLDEEDAENGEFIDERTKYLFHDDDPTDTDVRNPLNQMRTTKDLLTETQRIAYVGLCKLVMVDMATDLARKRGSTKIARSMSAAYGSMAMWAQKMTMRLYAHMDISQEEQLMIEQLSSHGVEAMDLTPTLMQNARVRNPMQQQMKSADEISIASSSASTLVQPEAPLPEYSAENNSIQEVKSPAAIEDAKTLDIDIRWTALCDLFLVLVADSVYDARSRTLLERVGQALQVDWLDISKFEKRVTDALDIEEGGQQNWKEDEIIEHRRKKSLKKKYVYMGLATIGGGLVIGLSAGLLAPVIGAGLAAGFTTIGIAGTSGFLAGAGGAAIVTTTGVAVGARIGSKGMARRMGHVRTFEFRPLHNNERVNLIVTVSGWLSSKEDDVRVPFSTVDPIMGDLYSLLWEPDMLTSMGQTINILATEVLTQSIQQVLGSTVLVALMSSLQWPLILTKLGYLLDNPWSVSLDRAWSAGLILADTLMQRNLGVRPVTLVGFSLGARVIFSCLVELAKRQAFGLVQNVILFGTPLVVHRNQFVLASSMVSGRFVNAYSRKDWILGYLFRATSGGLGRVAGLAPVDEIYGIDNMDCTEIVDGHMGYREAMPRLLKKLGWEVISEEFTEIEDPDPDRQRERQRELIVEFEKARKQMEQEQARLNKQKKKKKGIFSFMKSRKKEWWEMYDDDDDHHKNNPNDNNNGSGYNNDPMSPSSTAAAVASLPKNSSDHEHHNSVKTGVASSSAGPTPTPTPGRSRAESTASTATSSTADDYEGTIFDVDAIRRELANNSSSLSLK